MAKRYTSKIQVRCWKEHTCVGCGAVYAYELIRSVSGTGTTAEKAQINCRAAVQRTIDRATDLESCPTCGLYQPDMIAQRRSRSIWATFVMALIAFGVILGLRGSNAIQSDLATKIAAAACAVAALILVLGELKNPNRDTESNRLLASQRVAGGKIRLTPGQSNARIDDVARPPRSPLHLLTLLVLLASGAIAAAPEIVRSRSGWPFNETCYPAVVGPGDTTRIYLPQKINSVKGYWRGSPMATVQIPDGPSAKKILLDATTNQNTWGGTINVKSSEKDSSSSPWVSVTLPNNPDLGGKTVTCDIQLTLEYPEMTPGGGSYRTTSRRMEHTLKLQLGPAGAGARYDALWWETTAGAMVAVLLCAVLLAANSSRLQRTARPTRTYT